MNCRITPCRIIRESCLIKPSGLETDCFTFCDYAKALCEEHNLTKKPDIDADEIANYLNNRLREMKEKDPTGKKFLKRCLVEVINKIIEGEL